MARNQRTKADDDESQGNAPSRRAPPKPRSRWRSRLFMFIVLLAALVASAPTLVTRTPLRNVVLSWALADLNGQLTVGDAAIGWLSPLVVRDVQLNDAAGRPVAHVAAIDGEKRLLDLIASPRELGRYRITRPQVELILRADGSNLEDIVPKSSASSGGGASSSVNVWLEVIDGAIKLRDSASGAECDVQQLNAQLALGGVDPSNIELQAAGSVKQAEGGGPFQCQFSARDATDAAGHAVKVGRLALKAQDFPLELPQALVSRALPDVRFSGRASSDLQCEWGLDQTGRVRRSAKGSVSLRRFMIAAPSILIEPLALASVDIPCDLTWEAGELKITRFEATCDVGRLTLQATVPDADRLLETQDWRAMLRNLARGSNELTGQLDVAQLARRLPRTLGLRDDTQLTSGLVDVQLTTRPEQAASTWLGRVEASRLAAVHQGREVSWEQPLRVAFAARDEQRGLVIDRLQCQSDFLQIDGSGTADAMQLAGTLDLNRLATELGKFVDLSTIRLAGQGTTQLTWQRQTNGAFQGGGQLTVNGFELATAGATPWTEAQLVLTATLKGSLDDQQALQQVTAAQAALVSGSDKMTATLRAPVVHPASDSIWPLDIQAQGGLATWMRRLTPLVGPLPGLETDGQLQCTAQASLGKTAVDVERCDLAAQALKVRGWGLFIDEPTAKARVAGRYDSAAAKLDVRELVLETSAVSAQSRDAQIGLAKASAHETRGELTLDGNLHKLCEWFHDPAQPRTWELSGTLKGRTVLAHQGGKTSAAVEATADNVLATPRGARQWHEPSVRLQAAADYDHAADSLAVRQFDVQSDMLAVQAAGQLQELSARRWLQAEGQLTYDLAKIQRVLQPYTGAGVQLAGRETRPFHFAGPLASPATNTPQQPSLSWLQQSTADMEMGWEWMSLWGFPLGRGALRAEMRDGLVRTSPLEAAVGGGRIRLTPQVRLGPPGAELLHPAGVIVEQVELSPELCQQALRHAMPVLSGVTQVDGRVSVSLDACRLPLAAPATGELAGRVTVHSLEFSSGPVIQELASLLGRTATLRLQRETEVPFRMVGGRVYHQNLELAMGNSVIRTQGSVGLDESLALLVDLPMPMHLLAPNLAGSAIAQQSIRVPVGGTLSRPTPDAQEVNRLLGQSLREATGGLLRDGLNRGIDQLFGPAAQLPGNQR